MKGSYLPIRLKSEGPMFDPGSGKSVVEDFSRFTFSKT